LLMLPQWRLFFLEEKASRISLHEPALRVIGLQLMP